MKEDELQELLDSGIIEQIEFKRGKYLYFRKRGEILVSSSVIFDKRECPTADDLEKLKAQVRNWFYSNARNETKKKYTVRLPSLEEALTFEEIPYQGYWLADKTEKPIAIFAGKPVSYAGTTHTFIYSGYGGEFGVRVVLEERRN